MRDRRRGHVVLRRRLCLWDGGGTAPVAALALALLVRKSRGGDLARLLTATAMLPRPRTWQLLSQKPLLLRATATATVIVTLVEGASTATMTTNEVEFYCTFFCVTACCSSRRATGLWCDPPSRMSTVHRHWS
jgi:hypothetical protein